MEYLFVDLEAFINKLKPSSSGKEIVYLTSTEIDRVKFRLKESLFQAWDDAIFEKFTKVHHESLIDLLAQMIKLMEDCNEGGAFLKAPEDRASPDDLLQIYQKLSELLSFIHKHFDRYIPQQESIPVLFRGPLLKEIEDFLNTIKSKLPADIDEKLVDLALKPLSNFLKDTEKCTWHNLFYSRMVYKELSKHPAVLTGYNLLWSMYYLNYNSTSFYKFFTAYINSTDTDNYLENLYYFQKKIRQTHLKPNLVYKLDNPSIFELMEKWLEEEIRYFKRTRQLKMTLDTGTNTIREEEEKIFYTGLTVAELALLKRTMQEVSLLKIQNPRKFFTTIARNFRTKNAENISLESIRVKFYSADQSVKTSLKEKLIKMLNCINRDLTQSRA